jgi:Tripartite tricarboxylate transporter TctB family
VEGDRRESRHQACVTKRICGGVSKSRAMSFERSRDYYAGALIALIGVTAAYEGSKYGIGTLEEMGSGFFPTAVGLGMILIGAAIAMAGGDVEKPAPGLQVYAASSTIDWRGWLAIIAGTCLFMALAEYTGLLPAIFACVFVSALGSKSTRWKEALILAACVTAFGVALFALALKVQLPILRGI